jgi:hypothetical protein
MYRPACLIILLLGLLAGEFGYLLFSVCNYFEAFGKNIGDRERERAKASRRLRCLDMVTCECADSWVWGVCTAQRYTPTATTTTAIRFIQKFTTRYFWWRYDVGFLLGCATCTGAVSHQMGGRSMSSPRMQRSIRGSCVAAAAPASALSTVMARAAYVLRPRAAPKYSEDGLVVAAWILLFVLALSPARPAEERTRKAGRAAPHALAAADIVVGLLVLVVFVCFRLLSTRRRVLAMMSNRNGCKSFLRRRFCCAISNTRVCGSGALFLKKKLVEIGSTTHE